MPLDVVYEIRWESKGGSRGNNRVFVSYFVIAVFYHNYRVAASLFLYQIYDQKVKLTSSV